MSVGPAEAVLDHEARLSRALELAARPFAEVAGEELGQVRSKLVERHLALQPQSIVLARRPRDLHDLQIAAPDLPQVARPAKGGLRRCVQLHADDGLQRTLAIRPGLDALGVPEDERRDGRFSREPLGGASDESLQCAAVPESRDDDEACP